MTVILVKFRLVKASRWHMSRRQDASGMMTLSSLPSTFASPSTSSTKHDGSSGRSCEERTKRLTIKSAVKPHVSMSFADKLLEDSAKDCNFIRPKTYS